MCLLRLWPIHPILGKKKKKDYVSDKALFRHRDIKEKTIPNLYSNPIIHVFTQVLPEEQHGDRDALL